LLGLLNFLPGIGKDEGLFYLNLPLLVTILMGIVYIKVDTQAGSATFIWNLFLTLVARALYLNARSEGSLNSFIVWNLVLHVIGWAAQILAHEFIEGMAAIM
jgi:uncharacterized membrane protein YGL010W